MPLKSGHSNAIIKANFNELNVGGQIGSARMKAIRTLMRRKNMSFEAARAYQAGIISRVKAGRYKGRS